MTRWEYTCGVGPQESMTANLAQMGAQGWELAAALPAVIQEEAPIVLNGHGRLAIAGPQPQARPGVLLIFKRSLPPVEPPADQGPLVITVGGPAEEA